MTLSGHLEERIGVQMTIALGCLIMVSGVLLTSLAVQFSAVAIVFTYGCMFGTGQWRNSMHIKFVFCFLWSLFFD